MKMELQNSSLGMRKGILKLPLERIKGGLMHAFRNNKGILKDSLKNNQSSLRHSPLGNQEVYLGIPKESQSCP